MAVLLSVSRGKIRPRDVSGIAATLTLGNTRNDAPDGFWGASRIAAADTAWMLVACALVLLMTPALAFFYGGLVRSKNALNTMMMSFAALGVAGLAWVEKESVPFL